MWMVWLLGVRIRAGQVTADGLEWLRMAFGKLGDEETLRVSQNLCSPRMKYLARLPWLQRITGM